ncbi:hypothetical protein CBM2599_B50435 [Cupriavidus taiwanensis]|nr:hypothetical protein CBM2600_B10555 [Cupriavidus taiwanensis]SOY96503.1 hypothetical protein CBM2599_B50435 [Cupriavidus taiwanensis]
MGPYMVRSSTHLNRTSPHREIKHFYTSLSDVEFYYRGEWVESLYEVDENTNMLRDVLDSSSQRFIECCEQ